MQQTRKTKTSDLRRRQLACIHIAKKELGLDDSTYREMLRSVAGVDSAADLDSQGRQKVISHLKPHGYRSVHKSARKSGMHRPVPNDRAPLLSKIGALLADLKLPWSYSDSMAYRMHGIHLVRWCDPHQLLKIVAALIYYQKRRAKKDSKN